jgi:hypothetical protein
MNTRGSTYLGSTIRWGSDTISVQVGTTEEGKEESEVMEEVKRINPVLVDRAIEPHILDIDEELFG